MLLFKLEFLLFCGFRRIGRFRYLHYGEFCSEKTLEWRTCIKIVHNKAPSQQQICLSEAACCSRPLNWHVCVFPILCWIHRIRRIRQETFKHDWRLLKAFLCLPLAVCKCNGYYFWLVISGLWVQMMAQEFLFWKEKSSLILNSN